MDRTPRRAGHRQARPSRQERSVLLTLIESGGDGVFCDLPDVLPGAVGKFNLSRMTAVAELGAGVISKRMRDALVAYKARGDAFGAERPGERRRLTQGTPRGARRRPRRSARRTPALPTRTFAPMVAGLRAEGLSLRAIADRLNTDGHSTRRGMPWNQVQVARVLARAGGCPARINL